MKTSPDFNFWQKWLLTVSILFSLTGFVIALIPDSFLFEMHTSAIGEVFFNDSFPDEAEKLRQFLFGPIGGTVAGYFLLQTFVVYGPFKRKEPWAWRAIFWALMIWFITDSSVSIYHGAFFNVWMINIWTLILVGLPLMFTYSEFGNRIDNHE